MLSISIYSRLKSSYSHRVIQPSDAPCSNEHLARVGMRQSLRRLCFGD